MSAYNAVRLVPTLRCGSAGVAAPAATGGRDQVGVSCLFVAAPEFVARIDLNVGPRVTFF